MSLPKKPTPEHPQHPEDEARAQNIRYPVAEQPTDEEAPAAASSVLLRYRQYWLGYGICGLLLLLVLLAGSLSLSLRQSFAGRIYPNISVRGVAVGEMSGPEAASAISQQYADFLDQP
ncbi:MAG: hypothetical protein HC828_08390 [Blastochloris sp.]|nr:hypothetical protein [Blastochloris sp.]